MDNGDALTGKNVKSYWASGELGEWERRLRTASPVSVPGEILVDVLIPSRGYLRARTLEVGDIVTFVNVCGQQVVDIILYDASNIRNCASMSNSILSNGSLHLSTGLSIYAKDGRRLATVVGDGGSYAIADGGYCSDAVNELRYGVEGSPNCKTNLTASMARYGMREEDLEESCFTAFLDLSYRSDGSCVLLPSSARPGDHFDLRADSEVVISASACPSERSPTNNYNPTPIRVIISREVAHP